MPTLAVPVWLRSLTSRRLLPGKRAPTGRTRQCPEIRSSHELPRGLRVGRRRNILPGGDLGETRSCCLSRPRSNSSCSWLAVRKLQQACGRGSRNRGQSRMMQAPPKPSVQRDAQWGEIQSQGESGDRFDPRHVGAAGMRDDVTTRLTTGAACAAFRPPLSLLASRTRRGAREDVRKKKTRPGNKLRQRRAFPRHFHSLGVPFIAPPGRKKKKKLVAFCTRIILGGSSLAWNSYCSGETFFAMPQFARRGYVGRVGLRTHAEADKGVQEGA